VTSGAGIRLVLGTVLLTACGGGAPLMHPAHTLGEGAVTFAAGTSGRFSLGGLHDAERSLDAAAAIPGGATSPEQRSSFVKGALSRFAVAPGVAPFVAARVGLGHHNEAGLTYTGRNFRIDGRHAFEWPSLALSLGGSATGALSRPGDQPPHDVNDQPGADTGLRTISLTSLNGYGLELPVLFGYRSSADVVKLWAGVRAGFEHDAASVSLVEAPDTPLASRASATRYWGGGLVGFSIGLAPIEVRVEVDAAYESVHGNLSTQNGAAAADVAGVSLTPAMAISAKF
jgi:hypothetical protein